MKDKIIAKQEELRSIIHEVVWRYCYGKGNTDALLNYQDIGDVANDIISLYFQPSESKEQKIKDKCSKIYDKVKEAITPDKRTFEQAEKESKEQPPDGNYDIHVKMNTKKVMKGKLVMEKEQSEEEILNKHLTYGADTYDAGQRENIIKAMQEYAQQSRREDLIKYEIAQNTTGGKLHGSKERIIECIDKYLKPIK